MGDELITLSPDKTKLPEENLFCSRNSLTLRMHKMIGYVNVTVKGTGQDLYARMIIENLDTSCQAPILVTAKPSFRSHRAKPCSIMPLAYKQMASIRTLGTVSART